jgi:hypothetical protein
MDFQIFPLSTFSFLQKKQERKEKEEWEGKEKERKRFWPHSCYRLGFKYHY